MAGLLDYLFDPSTYSGPQGGLLSRLSAMQGNFVGAGFAPSEPSASFTDRFNALPNAPQPFIPSGRNFDETFAQVPNAPNQAQPIAIGNYQMPRLGSADLFQPQQVNLPQNAQPVQGVQQPAMPEQPQLPPAFGRGGPGFLDRLNSGLQSIGNGGSIIGALTGNQTDPQAIAQQNLRAQYDTIRQTLISNGENPQAAASKAMIAALNPEAAKTILPELFTTKEKFQKTGQDPYTGTDQYGFVNERDQTVNGKPINSQPTNATNPLGDPSLTGDAYLQSLPESIRSQVKAIVEGRMQPPSGFALKSPQIQSLMRAAAQYEPGFDLTKWGQRAATAKDFASGQAAKNVTSLNTVIGHLGDLKKAADALDNYSIPLVNEVGNIYHSATGGPKVNNFNLARNAVADELAKVFKGSGISDHEIAQWKGTLNAAQSPDQLKGAVKTAISLMESRLSALNDQRDRGMATQSEPRSLLNEKSQKALKEVEDWANGGGKGAATGKPQTVIQNGHTYTLQPDGSYK